MINMKSYEINYILRENKFFDFFISYKILLIMYKI